MQDHIYYTKYALQFADMQILELVTVFNQQVGNTGWTGMRAYHDQALIDEFQRRGIDVSAVYGWPSSAEVPFKIRPPPLPSALGKGGGLLCEVYFTLIVETFSKQCNTHSAICKL